MKLFATRRNPTMWKHSPELAPLIGSHGKGYLQPLIRDYAV
jgi:hypothetical protein